jgi:multidrug efflux pump subunit AcrB
MKLIEFAVHRWQLTLVFFILVTALGIQAFLTIPRAADPDVQSPFVIVSVVLPGADAVEIEETVAKPIEESLQGLDKIREVRSTSSNGFASVFAEFDNGTDVDQALDRVVRDVGTLRGQLPNDIASIAFRRARPTEAALLQLSLVSKTASWRRMEKYARDLTDRLNVVPDVRQTQVFGLPAPELRVAINEARLFEAQIAPTQLVNAIAAGGAIISAGSVNQGDRRFNVDAGGAYQSVAALEDAIVRTDAGRTVRVRDVATVSWADAERQHITRFNDQRAIFIAVKQKDSSNALILRENLGAALDAFRKDLPPDMSLEIGFDQTNDINRRLSQLGLDFAIAFGLVLITLIPLGFRASIVVLISIPLSLAMGVIVLDRLGFTLNQLSISGFIISLGLLVDDSIVVTESIARYLRQGLDSAKAAIEGTRAIAVAVLGSTGVLLFAFLPLTYIPEGAGDFVRGLPLAVLATVASSLIVSLTVIPFVASRLLKNDHGPDGNRTLQWVNGVIHRFYQPILHYCLARPKSTVWGAMAVCLAAIAAMPLLGFGLFPATDSPYFVVEVKTPEGSTVQATDRAVADVSRIIAASPGVTARMDNAGRGNPQIFYNNIPPESDQRYGEVFVTIDKWHPRKTAENVEALRKKLDAYSSAQVRIVQFENGPPVEAPVAIRVRGPDINELKRLGAEISSVMKSTPGMRDVENPLAIDRVDIDVGFNAAAASVVGVTAADVRRALRIGLSGERAANYRDEEGDTYPVVVRLPRDDFQTVEALKAIYVPTQTGGSVPLAQVANPQLQSGPAQITRLKLERTLTITGYNASGYLPSDLNSAVLEKLQAVKLPPGYHISVGGAAEVAARNTSGLGGIILLAIFGIFAVLVAEFGRFREVIVVAGVIPLGIFGGIIALAITGNPISFLTIIGFIALVGIEIKNSILLVDCTTTLREEGASLMEAIEKAGEIRFLPVLLTSVTAIGGLLPLAVSGAPLYAPLAWVIIGGLISSTFLSRIVTPVMYLLIARKDSPASAVA